ncbi:hypothetical protein Ae717Ps2_6504c [Pseudonocardia sp. Ae717_Ps2]|nr:hypothetical protein Ae717Ps2_6456c [Pseudonocardia sp. Ae717_Ps2]OLM28445.1 hypothetical protein Ae717Ps2_6504c [Pseudonocardia sp. Ae717_Ps2]
MGRGKCWWTSEFLGQTVAGEPIGTRPATVCIQVMTAPPTPRQEKRRGHPSSSQFRIDVVTRTAYRPGRLP